jgi:hypothetical protein
MTMKGESLAPEVIDQLAERRPAFGELVSRARYSADVKEQQFWTQQVEKAIANMQRDPVAYGVEDLF